MQYVQVHGERTWHIVEPASEPARTKCHKPISFGRYMHTPPAGDVCESCVRYDEQTVAARKREQQENALHRSVADITAVVFGVAVEPEDQTERDLFQEALWEVIEQYRKEER